MHLLVSTLIPAALITVVVMVVFLKIKRCGWINSSVLKLICCVVFVAITVGLLATGNMHFGYIGGFTALMGVSMMLLIL